MRDSNSVRVFDDHSYIEYIDKSIASCGKDSGPAVYNRIEKDVKSGKIVVRPFHFQNHLILDWRTELILGKNSLVVRDPITKYERHGVRDFSMYLDVCPTEEWRDLIRLSVLCHAIRNQRSCKAMRGLISRSPAVLYDVISCSRGERLEIGACKAGAKDMLNLVRVGAPNEEDAPVLPLINAKKKQWLGDACISDRRIYMTSDNNEFGMHIRFPDKLSVLEKAQLSVSILPLMYCLCGLYMNGGDIFSVGAASSAQMNRGFTKFDAIDSYVAYFFEVDEDLLYPADPDSPSHTTLTPVVNKEELKALLRFDDPALLNAMSDVYDSVEEHNTNAKR